MTRLRADFLLLLTAIIWGSGFLAQKLGMTGLGPMTFIAARFTLALLAISPLAWLEYRGKGKLKKIDLFPVAGLCLLFFTGVVLQQIAMEEADITNAGFLTSLYVLIVPFIMWVGFKQKPRVLIWPGCILAVIGVFLLDGGSLGKFQMSEWLLIACAVVFAFHVALMSYVSKKTEKPMMICLLQYATCAVLAWICVPIFEKFSIPTLKYNTVLIVYSGLVATAVAYTLQAIAQRYTPASDTAIILSSESLFAALTGYIMLHERLKPIGWLGCVLIFASILLVEAGVYLFKPRKSKKFRI